MLYYLHKDYEYSLIFQFRPVWKCLDVEKVYVVFSDCSISDTLSFSTEGVKSLFGYSY